MRTSSPQRPPTSSSARSATQNIDGLEAREGLSTGLSLRERKPRAVHQELAREYKFHGPKNIRRSWLRNRPTPWRHPCSPLHPLSEPMHLERHGALPPPPSRQSALVLTLHYHLLGTERLRQTGKRNRYSPPQNRLVWRRALDVELHYTSTG